MLGRIGVALHPIDIFRARGRGNGRTKMLRQLNRDDPGDRWTAGEAGPPVFLRHRVCGPSTHTEVRCASCGERLHALDVEVEPGPGRALSGEPHP